MLDETLEQELLHHYDQELVGQLEPFARNVAETLRTDLVSVKEVRPLIVWRVKSRDSLRRKLREAFGGSAEPDTPLSPDTLIENVQDLAGVRVIVHDRDNIDKMVEVLKRSAAEGCWVLFRTKVIDWDRDIRKAPVEVPDARVEHEWVERGSYRSRHITIKKSTFSPIRCEVQFRSVIEEAMFEAHHRLIYRVRQHELEPLSAVEEMLGPMTEMFSSLDNMVSDCYRWTKDLLPENDQQR